MIVDIPHILAYIGPGGGFAVVSSFFVVFITLLIAVPSLLVFPFRWLYHAIRYAGVRRKRMTRRVVVLGLDGLDPALMEQMIAAGELPNLAGLKWRRPLQTVPPPLSPVAWSSFATGCYPGSHRIFDFVHCNPRNYQPYLSSYELSAAHAGLRLGPIQLPGGGGNMKKLWKGEHFWDILGRCGVFSAVLRVPITFPAKIRRGHLLSGMCVPDLLGSQGISTLFTDSPPRIDDEEEGRAVRVQVRDGVALLPLSGPADPGRRGGDARPLKLELRLKLTENEGVLEVGRKRVRLSAGGPHSEWVPVEFKHAWGVVSGMCRFRLTQVQPHLKLYATAIHIDPSAPAAPVSNPTTFSVFLAKLFGRFGTLGIVEDTNAYEHGAIDGAGMLEQCYLAHAEREKQFFQTLSAARAGLVVCVFDTPDRVQHMFWREHEAGDRTIRDMYRRMDGLVGRTLKAIDANTTLFVMSDHGFNAFRRQVHVNSWLRERGYVVLKNGDSVGRASVPAASIASTAAGTEARSTNGNGRAGAEARPTAAGGNGNGSGCDAASQPADDPLWLRGVDMSRTVAFGFGLAGIHLNRKSFFASGILSDAQAAKVKAGLMRELEELVDPATGERPIAKAQDAGDIYAGSPYADAAPDIVIGWRPGYRVSWESAKGQTHGPVFSDNVRHWSGDHCFYPPMVPGVLLSTMALNSETPRIVDVGPTILRLLGVEPPEIMDGRPMVGPPAGRAESPAPQSKSVAVGATA